MYKDILMTIDLNDASSWQKALPTAVEYAQAFKSRLHIMTVVPEFNNAMVASYFPKDFEQKAMENAAQELHDFTSKHVPLTPW